MRAVQAKTQCTCAVLLGLAASLTGCLPPLFRTPAGYLVESRCDVLRCQPQSNPPNFDILVPSGFPSVATYQKQENVWKNKSKPCPLYVYPNNVQIVDVGTNEIPGSTLVMTNQGDWSLTGTSFLRLSLNETVQAAYLAYDARANPTPPWLREHRDYTPLTTIDGSAPLQVTTSIVDPSKNPPELVKLNLYRIEKAGPPGILDIPANNEGGPGWGNITQGSPAMYVVFIKPLATVDCSAGVKDNTFVFRTCYEASPSPENDQKALAAVEAAALAECALNYPGAVCTNAGSSSHYLPYCTASTTVEGFALTPPPTFFEQSSVVEFWSDESVASGTVKAEPFATKASGTLDFTYAVDQNGTIESIQILALHLGLEPFDADVGRIDDISVDLVQSATAVCTDDPPPVATPCSEYVIASDAFTGSANCTLDGQLVVAATTNADEISVLLEPDAHSFSVRVEGTLSATVPTDEEDIPVEISIHLAGEVLNYAPHAVGGTDGDPFAECQDGTNDTPLYLHAGDSFDIEDGMPNSANFDWYEDYGLVTEKVWGHGLSATIGEHQLAFGVHRITLVVRDNYGVGARDTLEITVHDTVPPTWSSVPGDLVFFPASSEPYQLTAADLGTAVADDECSSQVLVTNDAPADLRFPPGETLVTWTADDGRGQLATMVQRVTIIPLEDGVLPLPGDQSGTVPQPCAITTAARGTAMESDLQVLRRFRDERLLTNAPGRWVIALYDRISPPLARLIDDSALGKLLVRIVLAPLIFAVKYPLILVVIPLATGIGLGWLRRRRQLRKWLTVTRPLGTVGASAP